jgi:hypothetical protein
VIRTRRIATVLALAAVLACGGGAVADDSTTTALPAAQPAAPTVSDAVAAAKTDEGKRLFADGTAAYAKGDFATAAADFSTAYELTHAPELLYNLARCYEHLGDDGRAVAEYQMYLRMSPDAEDREDVEKRIAALEPPAPTTPPAAEADGAKTAVEEKADGVLPTRLAIESGVDVPLIAEWKRLSIPVDALLLFGLNGWLSAGFGLTIVGFAGDKPLAETGYPTGEFALHGDLAALKTIKGRFAFSARISVAPAWIFRRNHDNVFWLLARGGVGLHIAVWKSFGVIVEGIGGVGPVFNRDTSGMDNWKKVSLAVDVGGRAGITYAF